MTQTGATTIITEYDLTYRLNKLKCCFATKAAELVDKQRFGKECKDELCNLKLLGAYIEIIECYSPLPCNCKGEWELDGKLLWTPTLVSPYGTVVKAIMRPNANPGEFLFLRWQGAATLTPPSTVTYGYGDIVKFMGGGVGANQTKRGKYFISVSSPNPMGAGFHESGHWIELKCFPKQEV